VARVSGTTDLRFSRHVALPQVGAAGQARIARATALVVGLGGLGCPAALYLASCGTGRLLLNDFDTVDATNLPRQVLFTPADVGRGKAEAAAARLAALGAGGTLVATPGRLDEAALAPLVAAADVVLDCTDNFPSRWLVNRACAAAGRPLVTGAAIRFEGQVAVFRHDRTGGPCYRCLYGEDDENLQDCTGQGIFAPVAGAVGAVMATEALKLLAGLEAGLDGRLWLHDALSGSSRTVTIPRRAGCPACGARPIPAERRTP
jgi:adenylyltransferase/sulfurtransferase